MHSSIRRWIFSALLTIFITNLADAGPPPPAPRPQIDLPPLGEEVPLPKIRQICEHYGLHQLWRKIEADPPPRPFRSDGCTGWFDDWKGVSLYPAGFLHDLKYWAGYPGEEVERLVADAELMIDVARLLGSTEMAETMFHGVRLGGSDKFNASFSWGFGRRPLAPVPAAPAADRPQAVPAAFPQTASPPSSA
ncbi:hypothetical protein [Opitutus terrae]|uniref:Uncharacterized protein n=1 Tax=Opitutus terrae (strain DSM 11246 / JCM 15787 / PB90-1) TaxID=452637 RepID=B1ZML5_OPITP|nr:hypothetical protein [Opitutus terrae]ACB74360.1 hypothetical protein Oter_1072 [Opitutus terrae PB90-1]